MKYFKCNMPLWKYDCHMYIKRLVNMNIIKICVILQDIKLFQLASEHIIPINITAPPKWIS